MWSNVNTEPSIVVSQTEPPIVVSETEPIVVNRTSNVTTNIEEVVCVVDYKQELQGLVIINEQISSHYYKMHVAIVNTFVEYKYAFMILESYMMALLKQLLSVSILLSHMDIMLWECLILMALHLL